MEMKIFGYTIKISKGITENRAKGEKTSEKKVISARNAAKIKASRAKRKVLEAISELGAKGEEITAYKIAKLKGISYNTAKKYLETYKS